MKKIVALVLSLVMVLGLATTAFAATTSTGSVSTTSVTPVKAGWYTLATAGGSMTESAVTVTAIEKTTVTGKVVADVPYYVPAIYELNDTGAFYMEVAKANAVYALKNNGAYIYVAPVAGADVNAAIENAKTAVVIDSIVLPADEDVDCGDAYVTVSGADVAVPYYVSGDDVYTTSGANWAYFNGEFVAYGAAPSFKAHSFDPDTLVVKATDVKGVEVPVSVECENCEKTFKVVSAVTGFDNTWVKGVNYETVTGQGWAKMNGYVIVLDGATDANTPAAPEASEKVESAETFDAGIAMYVGMSVMAAAGSAVVLKKKD